MNLRKKRYRYNTRLIRKNDTYSVADVADLLNVHEGTVRAWMKKGLSPIDEAWPILFQSDHLIWFLKKRQQRRKRKCALNQLYCFKCREPRNAKKGTVYLVKQTPKIFLIKGRCAVCRTVVNKRGSIKNKDETEKIFGIKKIVEESIKGRSKAIDLTQFRQQTKVGKNESLKPTERTIEKSIFRVRARSGGKVPGDRKRHSEGA